MATRIPVHLLTAEAFALYKRHLTDSGMLAVQVTNRYLELEPVVRSVGAAIGMTSVLRVNPYRPPHVWAAEWVLLSAQPEILAELPRPAPAAGARRVAVWTDDYANVLSILR